MGVERKQNGASKVSAKKKSDGVMQRSDRRIITTVKGKSTVCRARCRRGQSEVDLTPDAFLLKALPNKLENHATAGTERDRGISFSVLYQ